MISDSNIAIVYPNKSSSSETFIQSHLKGLPANIFGLYGGWFPVYYGDDIPLIKVLRRDIVSRLYNKVKFKLFDRSNFEIRKQRALLEYLESNNIKAVLAEYSLTAIAIMGVCKRAKIPLIVHFHGFDAYDNKVIEMNMGAYRELFETAAKLVVVSNDMKEQIIKLGAAADKVFVNSCGVDTNKFKCKREMSLESTFLFAGRFANKKAPQIVLLAFYKVLKEFPNARLIMMGDGGMGSSGELFEACKQIVKSLKLEDRVLFTGEYSTNQLIETMSKAVCFIQHSVRPSSGDSEGTPVTLLEACSMGLPVIATRHGGIKDVVVHSETGFLVNEYDIEKTVEYMLILAAEKELAFQMGVKGRERIEELYSMDKSLTGLWNIIKSTF